MVATLHNIALIAMVAFLQPPLYIAPHSIIVGIDSTIVTDIASPAHSIAPHSIIEWKSCSYTWADIVRCSTDRNQLRVNAE